MMKHFLPKVFSLLGSAALIVGGTSCNEITAASDAHKGAAIGGVAGGVIGGVTGNRNQSYGQPQYRQQQYGQPQYGQQGYGQPQYQQQQPNRLLRAGVGAAAGAAGGYFIGKQVEENKRNEARIHELEQR